MNARKARKWIQGFLMIAVFACAASTAPDVLAFQEPSDANSKAVALLNSLSTEQKIGQLFLVTYPGLDVGSDSQIYDLIVNHYIGGVVLKRSNDNFNDSSNLAATTLSTIYALQSNAWNINPLITKDEIPVVIEGKFIPLFVGISQEGDNFPNDQLLSGISSIPNPMTIGATWNNEYAFAAGSLLGRELSYLGFNFLFGPSLDVIEVSTTEASGDTGSRSFGGDPYWVGLMGQSYISGLHSGSEGKMVVVAKHFPGGGGSDRSVEKEVATVRKSLEQLKQIELAPFFAVTGSADYPDSVTDGLLVSHIRYQGFQGNIRATTKPVSFDATALEQILSIQEFASWRESGGILVTDDLGSAAVKRFFDSTGTSFDAKQIARSAFLAGNDLLYTDQFISTSDPNSYLTIINTLEYFIQKYNEDAAFADRVDQSVLRLLTLKYSMYPNFMLSEVLPRYSNLNIMALSKSSIAFDLAQKAATLVSPSKEELEAIIPDPPQNGEKIVFITDVLNASQCSDCESFENPSKEALSKAVLRLYGPTAGGQIRSIDLASYSFEELEAYLINPDEWSEFERDLQNARWIVISMLDWDSDRPVSQAFKDFLEEKDSLLKFKQLIVFSFNAPYFLDSTEISKITAFYALYSKGSAFFDVAARLLFQEFTPVGSSPVSIPGVGYDLNQAVSPDPEQTIDLALDLPEVGSVSAETSTVEVTLAPSFGIGDSIPLRTGIILDNNQHPVPDGTVVKFHFTTTEVTVNNSQVETITSGGIARTSYLLQENGLLEARVTCDPASKSTVLQINVSEGQVGMITQIAPTPIVTMTPESEEHSQPTMTSDENSSSSGFKPQKLLVWLLVTFFDSIIGFSIYLVSSRRGLTRWGLRWGMLILIIGFIALTVFSFLNSNNTNYFLLIFSLVIGSVLLGGFIGWIWYLLGKSKLSEKSNKKTD